MISSLKARISRIEKTNLGSSVVNVIIKYFGESVYRCGGQEFNSLADAKAVNPKSQLIEVSYV